MSVHYKFKSAVEYDTLAVDGVHISLGDLKEGIIQQKRLGRSQPYDLQVTNAETQEVYKDDKTLIPKNSSLIVARMPVDSAIARRNWLGNQEPTALLLSNPANLMNTEDAAQAAVVDRQIREMTDITKLTGSETDKINVMMAQSTLDYHPSRYVKLRNSYMTGKVPQTYKCYKCHQGGHWVINCPLNQDMRKSTGIPSKFLKEVNDPNTPGVMITATGKFVVFRSESVIKNNVIVKEHDPPPTEIICLLCKEVMKNPVITPCCTNAYCDECIRNHLLDSEENFCCGCNESGILPDSLLPIRLLKLKCDAFHRERYFDIITKIQEQGPPTPPISPSATRAPSPLTENDEVSNRSPPKSPVEASDKKDASPRVEDRDQANLNVKERNVNFMDAIQNKSTTLKELEEKMTSEIKDVDEMNSAKWRTTEIKDVQEMVSRSKIQIPVQDLDALHTDSETDSVSGKHKHKKRKKEKKEKKEKKDKKKKKKKLRSESECEFGTEANNANESGQGNGTSIIITETDLLDEAIKPGSASNLITNLPHTSPNRAPVPLSTLPTAAYPFNVPPPNYQMYPQPEPQLIDDPLAVFNKYLVEKEKKKDEQRRMMRYKRSRSRSFSRSPPNYRSRSKSPRPYLRSHSRSPPWHRRLSPSERPPQGFYDRKDNHHINLPNLSQPPPSLPHHPQAWGEIKQEPPHWEPYNRRGMPGRRNVRSYNELPRTRNEPNDERMRYTEGEGHNEYARNYEARNRFKEDMGYKRSSNDEKNKHEKRFKVDRDYDRYPRFDDQAVSSRYEPDHYKRDVSPDHRFRRRNEPLRNRSRSRSPRAHRISPIERMDNLEMGIYKTRGKEFVSRERDIEYRRDHDRKERDYKSSDKYKGDQRREMSSDRRNDRERSRKEKEHSWDKEEQRERDQNRSDNRSDSREHKRLRKESSSWSDCEKDSVGTEETTHHHKDKFNPPKEQNSIVTAKQVTETTCLAEDVKKHDKKKKKKQRNSKSGDEPSVEEVVDEDKKKKKERKSKKAVKNEQTADGLNKKSFIKPVVDDRGIPEYLLPELSKWERDDEDLITPKNSSKSSNKEEKVTSDVIKKAENVLFHKTNVMGSRSIAPHKNYFDHKLKEGLRNTPSPDLDMDKLDSREAKQRGTSIQIAISSKTESQIGRHRRMAGGEGSLERDDAEAHGSLKNKPFTEVNSIYDKIIGNDEEESLHMPTRAVGPAPGGPLDGPSGSGGAAGVEAGPFGVRASSSLSRKEWGRQKQQPLETNVETFSKVEHAGANNPEAPKENLTKLITSHDKKILSIENINIKASHCTEKRQIIPPENAKYCTEPEIKRPVSREEVTSDILKKRSKRSRSESLSSISSSSSSSSSDSSDDGHKKKKKKKKKSKKSKSKKNKKRSHADMSDSSGGEMKSKDKKKKKSKKKKNKKEKKP